jgi:4-hydroxybenzoate polyprenyltransferase
MRLNRPIGILLLTLQIIVIVLLLYLGQLISASYLYYIGIFIAAMLVIYQQWLIIENQQNAFKAFLNNNWFGAAVFVGIVGHYYT